MSERINLADIVGLPDDLPDVVLHSDPEPSGDALAKIKEKTLSRIDAETAPKKQSRRYNNIIKMIVAASLLVVVAAVAAAGPTQVWAGLRNVLRSIPGFGVIEDEASDYTLVAVEKVKMEYGENILQVNELVVDSDGTRLGLEVSAKDEDFIEAVKQLFLLDDKGNRLTFIEKNDGGTDGYYGAHLVFPPLPQDARSVSIVIPMAEMEIKADVKLSPLFTLVTTQRYREEYEPGCIELTGIIAQPDATHVKLFIGGIKDISFWERREEIYLQDDSARYHLLESGYFHESFPGPKGSVFAIDDYDLHDVDLKFEPLPKDSRQVSLVLPLPDREVIFAAKLIPAAEIEETKGIVSASANGITLHVSADFTKDDTLICFYAAPAGENSMVSLIKLEEIVGSSGTVYELVRPVGWRYSHEIHGWHYNYYERYFAPVRPDEREIRFKLPHLDVQEAGGIEFVMPVPESGSIELDQKIQLGRFSFKLLKVEKEQRKLRIYYDVDGLNEYEKLYSIMATGFGQLRAGGEGAFEGGEGYIEWDLAEWHTDEVEIGFYNPVVRVEGSWTFAIAVE